MRKTVLYLAMLALATTIFSCTPEELEDNLLEQPTVESEEIVENTTEQKTEGEEGRRDRDPDKD